MADAPENSLAAFRNALAEGVTGLESDVWLTPEGRAVLSHGRPQPGALDLGQLLAQCGTAYDLSLDLKDPASVRAVLAVTRAAGHDPHRLWLCGRGAAPLRWRALDPDVRLVSDTRLAHAVPSIPAYLARLAAGGVQAVNLRRSRWTAGLVRRVHGAGLLAFAWDVQTEARLRAVLALGCDAVYSDHVDLLARRLTG